MSKIELAQIVTHLREHEQYQPELIREKIKPWVAQLETLAEWGGSESEVTRAIYIVRESVMLGLKEIEAETYVDRYLEEEQAFRNAGLIPCDESTEDQKKYREQTALFHKENPQFAGFPIRSENDKVYSPAERNILWGLLEEYRSGRISVRLARNLKFRKPSGQPCSIYPSDHADSVVSTLANVYGVDVDGYLADAARAERGEAELIEEEKIDLGIRHKSEGQIIHETVAAYAKTLEPKN